jgi:hypothetical protein
MKPTKTNTVYRWGIEKIHDEGFTFLSSILFATRAEARSYCFRRTWEQPRVVKVQLSWETPKRKRDEK